MTSLATDLRNLARRVAANRPEHRNPEAFAIEKQEIADELSRLARSADRQEANHHGHDR
jgi:hypothetical protein